MSHPKRSQSRANSGQGWSLSWIRAIPPTAAGTSAHTARTDPTRRVRGRSTSKAEASPKATQPALTVAAAGSEASLIPAKTGIIPTPVAKAAPTTAVGNPGRSSFGGTLTSQ